jgi:predicted TPR repeat methyltransferase
MRDYTSSWDVIASADTLCYFGDLEPVLQAASRALRPDGVLIFTLERLPEHQPAADPRPGTPIHPPRPGFVLQTHGRFAHDESAVRTALAAEGFRAVLMRVALRMEGGRRVEGILGVGRKPAAPINRA